jgi:hypothetical protein
LAGGWHNASTLAHQPEIVLELPAIDASFLALRHRIFYRATFGRPLLLITLLCMFSSLLLITDLTSSSSWASCLLASRPGGA